MKKEQTAVSSGFNSRSLKIALPVILALLFFVQSLSAFNYQPPYSDVSASVDGNYVNYTVYDASRGQWMADSAYVSGASNLSVVDGVVTFQAGNSLFMAVYDPSRGEWRDVSRSGGTYSYLSSSDGVVAWAGGVFVHCMVYDPATGWWEDMVWADNGVTDLFIADGVVVWQDSDNVYTAVYDPTRGEWMDHSYGWYNMSVSYIGSEKGLTAYYDETNGILNFRIYDPSRGQWIYAYAPVTSPTDLSVADGTLTWVYNGNTYTYGYNSTNGLWHTQPTVPLSYFSASPVWVGGLQYRVHFSDMSLGATSHAWDFGDGAVSTEQCPVHGYAAEGVYAVNLDVVGPGGNDNFNRNVTIDFSPPTGSVTINGGDLTTISTAVTLTLQAADLSPVQSMRFSNDNVSWTDWETYATEKFWTLSAGYGLKTVYVQYMDALGFISNSFLDTIELTAPPSLTVTSPNGGENLKPGDIYNIQWLSINMIGDVTIDLYKGGTFNMTLGTAAVADETFAWTVPAGFTLGDDYTVRVYQGAIEDDSDGSFRIIENQEAQNRPDFNGDGKIDLLWRNTADGKNTIWYLDGLNITGYGSVTQVTNQDWQIMGTGDFNGDGNVDILWHKDNIGSTMVWYMDNNTVLSTANITSVSDVDWRIVGTGDFNYDGKIDILWRHAANGKNVVWYMDDTTVLGTVNLTTETNLAWEIKATGDFNGDNKVDILWRNTSNGNNLIWYMDGVSVTGFGNVAAVTNQDWKLTAAGDFNYDGKEDILWRKDGTGENLIWYLDGATVTGQAYLTTFNDPDWTIVNN